MDDNNIDTNVGKISDSGGIEGQKGRILSYGYRALLIV